ncbi:hypothetical protein BDV93DRAFT_239616 [Ceratobasidium sp. AG-I]|nr:hypothetical protein BDV93DRAFT_239616 [Ceratobasidium sp. AG-I]
MSKSPSLTHVLCWLDVLHSPHIVGTHLRRIRHVRCPLRRLCCCVLCPRRMLICRCTMTRSRPRRPDSSLLRIRLLHLMCLVLKEIKNLQEAMRITQSKHKHLYRCYPTMNRHRVLARTLQPRSPHKPRLLQLGPHTSPNHFHRAISHLPSPSPMQCRPTVQQHHLSAVVLSLSLPPTSSSASSIPTPVPRRRRPTSLALRTLSLGQYPATNEAGQSCEVMTKV